MGSEKPQAQLTLYRGWDHPGCYVWSPFVTKVEARLRFAGLKYKAESGSVQKSPKGKLPYIEIERSSGERTTLSDSALIAGQLVEEGFLEDINSKLSPADRAHDLALRALLEDKWYFYQACEKWHENYYTMRGHILSKAPYPIQVVVGLLIFRNVSATLHGQGASRYTEEEIRIFGTEIWSSIDALLVDSKKKKADHQKPFWVLGGEGPSEVDTSLFGAISAQLVTTASPKSTRMVRSYPTVMEYAKRINDEYFPEYELWK